MRFDTLEKAGFRFSLNLHESPHPALSDDFWEDEPKGENPADPKPEAATDQPGETTPDQQAPERPTDEEPTGPAPDGGKWLDRYDNYEDAEKAYKALQGDYTRLINGLKPKNPELIREILGQEAAAGYPQMGPYPPQGYPQEPPQAPGAYGYGPQVQNPTQMQQVAQVASQTMEAQKQQDPETFWKRFSDDPQGVLQEHINQAIQAVAQPVAQFMTQTAVRQRIAEMRANTDRYPGFREIENDIADFLQANPFLAQQPNGLEIAYNAVRGIHSSTVERFVGRQSEQQRQQTNQLKQRAAFEGQQARQQMPQGGQEPVSEEDQIGDAIVAASRRGRLPW